MQVKDLIKALLEYLEEKEGKSKKESHKAVQNWFLAGNRRSFSDTIEIDDPFVKSMEKMFSIMVWVDTMAKFPVDITIYPMTNKHSLEENELEREPDVFEQFFSNFDDDKPNVIETPKNEYVKKPTKKRSVESDGIENFVQPHKKTRPMPVGTLPKLDADSESEDEEFSSHVQALEPYFPPAVHEIRVKSIDDFFDIKAKKVSKIYNTLLKNVADLTKSIKALDEQYVEVTNSLQTLQECTSTHCKQHSLIEFNSTIKKNKKQLRK